MKKVVSVIVLILSFLNPQGAEAQFINDPCVDTNRIDPFFQCNLPDFEPVCGCNFVTYRNECIAFNNHGVNFIEYDGVCQNEFLFLDAYPTLTSSNITIFMQMYAPSTARLEIRDAYGKLWHFRNFTFTEEYLETLQVPYFPPGVYYIIAFVGEAYRVKKFIKYTF
jgi:hypothetical protein